MSNGPNILNLPVVAGTVPAGQCPGTLQEMANLFASIYTVPLPLSSGVTIIAQKTPPTSQFQTPEFAWLQLDDSLRPVRLYFFYTAWLSLHPLPPGFTMIWTGVLPNFDTFDGGDASGTLSDVTGHTWEEVTDLRAKFPIGAGTLPVSPAGTGATLSPGDTGGEQLHVLTIQEGAQDPAHTHATGKFNSQDGTYLLTATQDTSHVAGPSLLNKGDANPPTPGTLPNIPDASGSWTATSPPLVPLDKVDGHNTMPPFFTVYFLRRTARKFYTV